MMKNYHIKWNQINDETVINKLVNLIKYQQDLNQNLEQNEETKYDEEWNNDNNVGITYFGPTLFKYYCKNPNCSMNNFSLIGLLKLFPFVQEIILNDFENKEMNQNWHDFVCGVICLLLWISKHFKVNQIK